MNARGQCAAQQAWCLIGTPSGCERSTSGVVCTIVSRIRACTIQQNIKPTLSLPLTLDFCTPCGADSCR